MARSQPLLGPLRCILLAVVVMVTVAPVPASAQEDGEVIYASDVLCELLTGEGQGDPFIDPNFIAEHCWDLSTNSYVYVYPSIRDAIDAGPPVEDGETRVTCTAEADCYRSAYDRNEDIGEAGALYWWEHQYGGVHGWFVQFRRDSYWVVVGDPLYNDNVSRERAVLELAHEIDERLKVAFGVSPAAAAAPTPAPQATAAPVEQALAVPATQPTVVPATSVPTTDDDNGFPVPGSVLAIGALVLAAGLWFFFAPLPDDAATDVDTMTSMPPSGDQPTMHQSTSRSPTQATPAPSEPPATESNWWN